MTGEEQSEGSALRVRLKTGVAFSRLDLDSIEQPDQLAAPARYQVGDLIRVARSGSHPSVGVVVGHTPTGELRVEVEMSQGQSGLKELGRDQVAEMNPLKIGDQFEFQGRSYWVEGLDAQGELVVVTGERQRADAHQLAELIRRQIAEGHESTMRHPSFRDDDTGDSLTLTGAMRVPALGEPAPCKPYTPIESIIEADPNHGLIAGNKETNTVYNLQSPLAGAALHTNRGFHYKDWNEDGGALFADRAGRLYVGVFDQAGGEGSDSNARGAASAIAAKTLFDQMKVVADQKGDADRAEAALIKAALEAHRAILARGLNEVTTYLGAMIDATQAVIVNCGDSGAMHFSAAGQHLRSTEEQGIGNLLLEGLGKQYPEGQSPDCRAYRWAVTPGEYLVFGSDGLLDTRLSREEIGAIIVRGGTAANATRALRDIVSQRMKMKAGKPDNLTILVVRVGEAPQ